MNTASTALSSSTAACASCATTSARATRHAAPCGHSFCRACLQRMARLALKDRALVPLRCCRKELSTETVALAFATSTQQDRAQYDAFLAERARAWPRSELASDREYAASVARVGARQCPGCGVGVLRDFGCVHMTCPRGHEFCFTCLRPWGACKCPLIPEHELRAILHE